MDLSELGYQDARQAVHFPFKRLLEQPLDIRVVLVAGLAPGERQPSLHSGETQRGDL